jgi:hypothetical protein
MTIEVNRARSDLFCGAEGGRRVHSQIILCEFNAPGNEKSPRRLKGMGMGEERWCSMFVVGNFFEEGRQLKGLSRVRLSMNHSYGMSEGNIWM